MIEYYKNLSLENLFYTDENGILQEEEWRDLPKYEKIYQLSTLGRAKSLERFKKNWSKLQRVPEKILVQSLNTDGYLKIKLSVDAVKKDGKIHQLMGITFLGHTPCGLEIIVDHKVKGNKLDNRLSNLQLITNMNNCNKDSENKVGIKGVSASHSKFTCCIWWKGKSRNLGSYTSKEEAGEIRKLAFDLIEAGESIEHLIKRYEDKTTFKPKKIDTKDYDNIKSLYDEGKTLREVGEIYNVTKNTISSILKTRFGMKELPRRYKK